eukprot:2406740-Amphidinium_carterae.2
MVDYVKDTCALKNVFVQVPALYTNRCSIVFANREEAEVWLAHVKQEGLQHEGANLRASKGLTGEQKKRGYKLKIVLNLLKEKVPSVGAASWELCFKSMAVYVDGKVMVHVRNETLLAGEVWPSSLKIEDLRALCRETVSLAVVLALLFACIDSLFALAKHCCSSLALRSSGLSFMTASLGSNCCSSSALRSSEMSAMAGIGCIFLVG